MKWHYYGFKETQELWKQDERIKENPSSKYHLWILDKKEARAIATKNGSKIKKVIINLKPRKMAKDKKDKKSKKEKKGKEQKPAKEQKNKKDKKEKKPAAQAGGQRKFSGSIALTKLQHVIMKKKGKKGKKIECIVIPVDANYIERGVDKDGKLTGALYLNLSVITKTEEDDYGQHGFIGQNVSSKAWKAAKDKEKEKMGKLPILGNIKDFSFDSDNYSADTNGSAGDDIDEDDDLPF